MPPGRRRPSASHRAEPLEGRVLLSTVGFQSAVYPGDPSTQSLLADDFNGDGRADLVALDSSADGVLWYRGKGDGTFAAPLVTSLGRVEAYSAVAGDFNSDGKADLLVVSVTANAGLLLKGNGDGSFQSPVQYAVGAAPAAAAVGDFNLDGRLDFATADSGSNTVSVMLQQPDGSFVANPMTVGQAPAALASADFDGDGVADLAVGGADGFYLLKGNRNGTPAASFVSLAGLGKVTALAAADLNADGRPDLAATVLGPTSAPVQVLLNSGSGTFTASALPAGNETPVPAAIVAANLMNDGRPDLLAIGSHAGSFQSAAYTNSGGGAFALAKIEDNAPGLAPAAVADFNGDGLSDIVTTTSGNLIVSLAQPIVSVQGASLSGFQFSGVRVATFVDNARPTDGGGAYAATVSWGDGSSSAATVVADGTGAFRVLAGHTYKYNRTYSYSVSIIDAAGHPATATGTVTVANAPPTVTIAEFPAPTTGFPDEIAPGPGADLWYLENGRQNSGGSSAVLIDSTGRLLQQTTLANQNAPRPTASDSAGNLWLKEANGTLYELRANDPLARSFSVPALTGNVAMARGADGNVWFLGTSGAGMNRLGRIGSDGTVSLVTLSKAISGVSRMTFGPDGAFWAGEANPQTIARILPDGTVSEIAIPIVSDSGAAAVTDSAADGRGNLWFAMPGASVIGRIAPDGTITQFPRLYATRLAADASGTMWFTNPAVVGRLATDGSATLYTVPGSDFPPPNNQITGPFGLTEGSDGNLWFTEQFAQKVGRIDTAAAIVVKVPPLTSARAAVPFAGQVATFTDPRAGRPVTDYAASINWGDSTVTPGIVTRQADGSFAVSGTHTYGSERVDSALTVTVTPVDDVPARAFNTVALDYPLNLVRTPSALMIEGSSDPVGLLEFRDEDLASSQFTASINWGDRATGTGLVTRTSAGTYLVSGSHSYHSDGTYSAHVHVLDSGGSALDADTTVRISDALQFEPPTAGYGPGPGPVAAGDMNGDGLPDLVAAGPGSVAVSLALTSASFELPHYSDSLPNASAITQIALADFNGDRKLDVLYSQPGILGLLHGGGDGSLRAPSTVPVLGDRFAIADFNGDGKLDVVSNGNGSKLTVLLGNGDGTFEASFLSLPRAGSSYSVVTGDFNADGKADIAVTGADPAGIGAAITVWLGSGDGTFSPPATFPLYPGSSAAVGFIFLAAADLNGDGKPDLVAADRGSQSLSILLNAGDGTFLPATDSPLDLAGPFSTSPVDQVLFDFHAVDMNGDGIPDLLFSNAMGGGAVRIRLGRGDGTFLAETVLPNAPGWLTTSDFSRDGLVDLAVAAPNYGPSVYFATPITVRPVPVVATEGQSQTFTVATFRNEDGPGIPQDYAAGINWGDNHSSIAQVVEQQDGSWAVIGTHTYTRSFPFQITVNVGAPHALHASAQSVATVNDAPITVTAKTITGVAGVETTGIVADFTDANSFEPAGDYTATIDWDDGSPTSAGTLVPDGQGGWLVYASHTFKASASFGLDVQVQDGANHPTYNGFATANIASVTHGGGSISGTVFADFNRDGIRETGEPPLLGWTVYVDTNNNGQLDPGEPAAISSAAGYYQLGDVPGGTWTVREVVPAGWRTDVPAAQGQTVTTVDGQILEGHDLPNVHAPPAITSARVDYGSPFADLLFTFDEDVKLPASYSATVRNIDTGDTYPLTSLFYDSATRTVRFLQSLQPDGRYEAVFSTAPITDAFGQHPTQAQYTLDFSLLTGDLNHNGKVNFADLLTIAQHMNQVGGYDQGDLNNDGQIDFQDLLLLAQHFGRSLASRMVTAAVRRRG